MTTQDKVIKAHALVQEGLTMKEAAEKAGIHYSTYHLAKKKGLVGNGNGKSHTISSAVDILRIGDKDVRFTPFMRTLIGLCISQSEELARYQAKYGRLDQ